MEAEGLTRAIRNTPTCVGKTGRVDENNAVHRETPPRAWGRRIPSTKKLTVTRNTPTCVGKTRSGYAPCAQGWKHPHVRGEDRHLWTFMEALGETPPRAWGRPLYPSIASFRVRNTPTCVGKTLSSLGPWQLHRKHPHVRGEDTYAVALDADRMETPPRAWGRRCLTRCHLSGLGNTPTCVGKTCKHVECIEKRGKHPHVRGEDQSDIRPRESNRETPPRAWGRHLRAPQDRAEDRNTPTCVGKTWRRMSRSAGTGKHPHVRGEDAHAFFSSSASEETPPRAWGRPSP